MKNTQAIKWNLLSEENPFSLQSENMVDGEGKLREINNSKIVIKQRHQQQSGEKKIFQKKKSSTNEVSVRRNKVCTRQIRIIATTMTSISQIHSSVKKKCVRIIKIALNGINSTMKMALSHEEILIPFSYCCTYTGCRSELLWHEKQKKSNQNSHWIQFYISRWLQNDIIKSFLFQFRCWCLGLLFVRT